MSGPLAVGGGRSGASFEAQGANVVLAGPVSGGIALPAFRALVAADIPDLSGAYASVAHAHMRTWPLLAPTSSADNTITPTQAGAIPLTLKAPPGGSDVTYGADLLADGSFDADLSGWTVGANWAWDAGSARHTPGSIETLSQVVALANGTVYEVRVVVSGRTTGSVTPTCPAATEAFGAISGNSTYYYMVTGTSGVETLTLTPSADWDGRIDSVSVRAIAAPSVPVLIGYDSDNAILFEIRGKHVHSNLAMGGGALRSNTTGYYNLAMGVNALYANTTGYYNLAMGVNALRSNTTGYYNLVMGVEALRTNTTGHSNLVMGVSALYANTTGHSNLAMGVNALYANTTGYYNLAMGVNALRSNTTGHSNLAMGVEALRTNTTGHSNLAMGVSALRTNTTGHSNLVMGTEAGYSPGGVVANATTTGTYQTFVGYRAGLGSPTQHSYATAIGANAVVDAANSIVLGRVASDSVGIGIAAPAAKLHVVVPDAGTSNTPDVATFGHHTSATPGAGFGAGLLIQCHSSTPSAGPRDLARITAAWLVATDASRLSQYDVDVYEVATARRALHARAITGGTQVAINHATPTSTLDVDGDIETSSTGAFLMGDPGTDGSWRIVRSGNDLVIQRREAGVWVAKQTIAA